MDLWGFDQRHSAGVGERFGLFENPLDRSASGRPPPAQPRPRARGGARPAPAPASPAAPEIPSYEGTLTDAVTDAKKARKAGWEPFSPAIVEFRDKTSGKQFKVLALFRDGGVRGISSEEEADQVVEQAGADTDVRRILEKDPHAKVSFFTEDSDGDGIADRGEETLTYQNVKALAKWGEKSEALKTEADRQAAAGNPGLQNIFNLINDDKVWETLSKANKEKLSSLILLATLMVCGGNFDMIPIVADLLAMRSGLTTTEIGYKVAKAVGEIDAADSKDAKELADLIENNDKEDWAETNAATTRINNRLQSRSHFRSAIMGFLNSAMDLAREQKGWAKSIHDAYSQVISASAPR